MQSNRLPTSNSDALRIFVSGNEQFQAYLTSGDSRHLEAAGKSFTEATGYDPNFQLAVFYRSLVQTELRQAHFAIQGLNEILRAGVTYETEVLIHLAYAHIKLYTDHDFLEAERLLTNAQEQAVRARRTEIEALIGALTVFLYAVMGGYFSVIEKRPAYLAKAISLGNQLLSGPLAAQNGDVPEEARFELLNGLGIAHMRAGEAAMEDDEKQRQWALAEDYFGRSLQIHSTSVRVMHNWGNLYGMRALHARKLDNPEQFAALHGQAKGWFLKSLTLNANDQFPHYKLSQLFAMVADWPTAQEYSDRGVTKSGAVKQASWTALQAAIDSQDSSRIRW